MDSLLVAPTAGNGRRPGVLAPKRSSARLKAKEADGFVPMATKAIQCKALRESLATCSASLKHVTGRCLLKRKNPIGALDLKRLARAAGLSYSGRCAVTVVATGITVAP